jgi:4-amino-4-deoxy-L-arabinose transferase-like glycosyltransferase
LGQAYGICLFTTVGAFCLAIATVEQRGWWRALASGACAGAAAASSLLAAAVAPVLVIWIWWCNRAGSRWSKAAAFACGGAIPFLPVFWLAAQSPWVVWFNVVKYQLTYRVV